MQEVASAVPAVVSQSTTHHYLPLHQWIPSEAPVSYLILGDCADNIIGLCDAEKYALAVGAHCDQTTAPEERQDDITRLIRLTMQSNLGPHDRSGCQAMICRIKWRKCGVGIGYHAQVINPPRSPESHASRLFMVWSWPSSSLVVSGLERIAQAAVICELELGQVACADDRQVRRRTATVCLLSVVRVVRLVGSLRFAAGVCFIDEIAGSSSIGQRQKARRSNRHLRHVRRAVVMRHTWHIEALLLILVLTLPHRSMRPLSRHTASFTLLDPAASLCGVELGGYEGEQCPREAQCDL